MLDTFQKSNKPMNFKCVGMLTVIALIGALAWDAYAVDVCGVSHVNRNFNRFDMITDNNRLVGGMETKPHSWPWMGQILSNGRHQCGSALIDPEILITAAHCFAKSRDPINYKILLGGHETFTGQAFSISEIIIHPLYQIRASAYDIAILRKCISRISPSAIMNNNISTICLPTAPPPLNKMCVVTGWGRLKEDGERARALREIHIPIMPPYICNNYRHYAGRMHPASMICAGYNAGRIDSCQGDSGGPLQCQNEKGIWELQGVVSWGIGCAQPEHPGIYSRIYTMLGWIRMQASRLTNNAI